MSDQDTIRLLVSAGFALVGVLALAYAIRARLGRTPAARRWMGNEFGAFTTDERMTVLGVPCLGILSLCVAASILPVIGLYLLLITAPVGLVALLGVVWARMLFIPLPDVIYPRWARPLRDRNRRAERATKEWLRRR